MKQINNNNKNKKKSLPRLEIPVKLHAIFNLKSCFWDTSFPWNLQ